MGSYLDLGTQRVYYEEHGAGPPVVLLHGGLQDAGCWHEQVPALATAYRVIVPERRGHGRTPDVPGPYSTEIMAAETAAVMTALVGGPAHVIGWSDGAYIAAFLALRRPELVDRLVLIGQAFSASGETATARALLDQPDLADYFRDDHVRLSPDGPAHFGTVFDKILDMWRHPLELPLSELAGITAPTLVMQGDDDGVRLDYSAALARALPDAQLAVVPGTGHAAPQQKPELVNRMLRDFLVREQPERQVALGSLRDPA